MIILIRKKKKILFAENMAEVIEITLLIPAANIVTAATSLLLPHMLM